MKRHLGKLPAQFTFPPGKVVLGVFAFLGSPHILSCGGPAQSTNSPETVVSLIYKMDRRYTNKAVNILHLSIPQAENYTLRMTGTGFESEVPLGESVPLRDSVAVTYQDIGNYQMALQVYQSDETVVSEDVLQWDYSLEQPGTPAFGFTEEATNDAKVTLTTASNRGKHTNEVWIEGDVSASEVGWHALTQEGYTDFNVSDSDGLKTITARYRNIYGTESSSQTISILRKSVGPKNCKISPATTITASGLIRVSMVADNAGDLFYSFAGDVEANGKYEKFTGSTVATASMVGQYGDTLELKVFVRDIAGNYCPTAKFAIAYRESYIADGIRVRGSPLWTDNRGLTVEPLFEHFDSDTVSMYIYGDIETTSSTFAWIPYTDQVAVSLLPSAGNRFIRVKYKLNGHTTNEYQTDVYLAPFIIIHGSSSPYTLSVSDIIGASSISISGCQETYSKVAYQPSFTCTSPSSTVTATYQLKNGTSVSRSGSP